MDCQSRCCHSLVGFFSRFVLLVTVLACPARADVVRLANGGESRGTVEPVPLSSDGSAEPDSLLVHTVHGSRITFAETSVNLVVKRKPIVEEYETRAKETPETVRDHLALAQWCRDKRLKDQSKVHFQKVVELDSSHAEAHKALDHILRDGEWHPRKEYMAERGYVKHKGKWITLEERDISVKSDVQRASERKWHRRVHLLHGWLSGRVEDRRKDAINELMALHDPYAVPALVKHFQDDNNVERRAFYVSLLGRIGGQSTTMALVKQGLLDVERAVRSKALAEIGEQQKSVAATLLVGELSSTSNMVIRRAAAALPDFGDETAVPALINALMTTHQYRVKVADNSGSVSFGSDGSFSMGGGGGGTRLPPEVELAMRSGQLPYGAIVIPPNTPQRTKMVTVRVNHQNPEVLSTLKELTGKNYGYDERLWRLWWQAVKNGTENAVTIPQVAG